MPPSEPCLWWPGKRPPAAPEPAVLHTVAQHGPSDNLLIEGDNLPVMQALLPAYAGRVQLIYIDPPFATGGAFATPLSVGGDTVRQVAYRDAWGDDFLQMMYDRLALMRALLAPGGSIFVHLDRRANSYVRLLLDELFGADCLVNEIVWCFRQGGRSARSFSHKHHTIYWYARNVGAHYFNPEVVRVPYEGDGGYQTSGKGVTIKGKTYRPHPSGKVAEDWWDLAALPPLSAERCAFPTQKPERLLRRIIEAASRPGDLAADFFCGSGVTPAAAERTGRRWLACDVAPFAVHTTRKRLLGIGGSFSLQQGADKVRADLRAETDGKRIRLLNVAFAADRPWQDYLDYWAVDGAYDGKVFRPVWRAFRTRRQPTIPLVSDMLSMEKPAVHAVAVHAVNMFGQEAFAVL